MAYSLPVRMDGACYYVSSLTGNLVRYSDNSDCPILTKNPPSKIRSALQLCNGPYTCLPPKARSSLCTVSERMARLRVLNKRFEKIGISNFLLLRMYAGLSTPLFASTGEALSAIHQIHEHREHWDRSCLIRGLERSRSGRRYAWAF